MDQTFSWSKWTSYDEVESSGVLAGEQNGNKVFVGRTFDEDGIFVPAKIIPAIKSSFYAYDDAEESSDQVEFLDHAADYHWVKSEDANIADAVTVSGSYIGRGTYNGNIVVGRVDTKTKQLVGSFDGEVLSLASFDVLIYKSKGVVYEKIQKASNVSSKVSMSKQLSTEYTSVSHKSTINGRFEESRSEQNYTSLANKIRQLEMEKLSYLNDKQSYEERLDFEQRKVLEMSHQLKRLRVENSRILKERLAHEENSAAEQQRLVDLELKVKEFSMNNSYMIKKLTNLEEAFRYEKLLVESISEKFSRSEMYGKTLLTKVSSLEETGRTQQQRIFELESEIMITASGSESLMKKLSDYEQIVKHLRLQMETFVKKLEISNADNDFLVQKLTLLTQTLRTYQGQLECLNNKLQSSKTVIASTHDSLSRATAQNSKYQAALSSCYVLNGELMTKVSAVTSVAQNQIGGDCALNLVDHFSGIAYEKSLKTFGYGKTATIMELTGSDSYLNFLQNGEDATAYGVNYSEAETNGVAHPEPFTPYSVSHV